MRILCTKMAVGLYKHSPFPFLSIGSADFAELMIVTDTATYRQTGSWTEPPRYFVCNNMPHLAYIV